VTHGGFLLITTSKEEIMFEIVMLFAFLYAVTCPLLPAKHPEKKLPAEKEDSRNQRGAKRSLTEESARRGAGQLRQEASGRNHKHAHAA
jgi:hypothetical protein